MVRRCRCGREAMIRTSWTDLNPGRRFWACPYSGDDCPWLGWYDLEMCKRSKEIIPGLLRKLDRYENEIQESKQKNKHLKKWLIASWCLFGLVVAYLSAA